MKNLLEYDVPKVEKFHLYSYLYDLVTIEDLFDIYIHFNDDIILHEIKEFMHYITDSSFFIYGFNIENNYKVSITYIQLFKQYISSLSHNSIIIENRCDEVINYHNILNHNIIDELYIYKKNNKTRIIMLNKENDRIGYILEPDCYSITISSYTYIQKYVYEDNTPTYYINAILTQKLNNIHIIHDSVYINISRVHNDGLYAYCNYKKGDILLKKDDIFGSVDKNTYYIEFDDAFHNYHTLDKRTYMFGMESISNVESTMRKNSYIPTNRTQFDMVYRENYKYYIYTKHLVVGKINTHNILEYYKNEDLYFNVGITSDFDLVSYKPIHKYSELYIFYGFKFHFYKSLIPSRFFNYTTYAKHIIRQIFLDIASSSNVNTLDLILSEDEIRVHTYYKRFISFCIEVGIRNAHAFKLFKKKIDYYILDELRYIEVNGCITHMFSESDIKAYKHYEKIYNTPIIPIEQGGGILKYKLAPYYNDVFMEEYII